MTSGAPGEVQGRLSVLSVELKALRDTLRLGGGREEVDAHHEAGKLTARERIDLLLDRAEPRFEIGLLLAGDGGSAPAAGVVTCLGRVAGREVVVVASDATVSHGSWWPETAQKILRAQEVAMRCRIPVLYLVDSQGAAPPIAGRVFPGQYGAGRVLYYASVMRRHLGVTQLAAVMGPCVGSAAYLPALSDAIVMVEGASMLALGGPDLVTAATGVKISGEELGGAVAHTAVSGVAHYSAPSDTACVEALRRMIGELPGLDGGPPPRVVTPPVRSGYELYDLVPDDPRQPYDMRSVLECLLDGDPFEEFQPEHAPEMICVDGRLEGVHVAVIANARGVIDQENGAQPRFGGVVYPETARKAAYFVERANRQGTPIVFVQDVTGFMVGVEAEQDGILRAGAELLEAMATATVPKIALVLGHASGAGHYAMAGQGFDPDFVISLPTGRLGADEGSDDVPGEACRAAAAGLVDEVLLPEELRPALGLLLEAARHNEGAHLGPFQIERG